MTIISENTSLSLDPLASVDVASVEPVSPSISIDAVKSSQGGEGVLVRERVLRRGAGERERSLDRSRTRSRDLDLSREK